MNTRVSSSLIRSLLIMSLLFVSVSCQPMGPSNQGTPDSSMQDVRVVQATEPTKATAKVEQFPLPNCGGTDKLVQSLGMYASATKRATVGARAAIKGGGEVAIPETAKLRLEIQVEASYQKVFESANSRLDSIQMSAAAGTHVVYTIVWEEQTFSSIVQYSVDGKLYEAPYTYKLNIPKLDTSYNVICSGKAQDDVANTPVPVAQPSPTPTTQAVSPTQPSTQPPQLAQPSPGNPQLTKCQVVARDLPQTAQGIASKFGLPVSRIVDLLHENCGGSIIDGFVVEGQPAITLQVYPNGCIDAPQDAVFSVQPVSNNVGGLRAYDGTVRAGYFTYRMFCR
jgi:hypothetical protein